MTGAVATAHPIATAIGNAVLERGGNAYDALLATSAALTVVLPSANGIGSDFFAVVHDGPVQTINGSGWAAAEATVESLRGRGFTAIPARGPLSALTVPGLVASWNLLAPRATRPFRALLEPAVRLARDGFVPTGSLVRAVRATKPFADDDWRAVYAAVVPGRSFRQPDLARTLASVQDDQGHSFYHGKIARAIEEDLRSKGGLLRASDLDGFAAEWTEPMQVRYRGSDVYTTPPNSQGATLLVWLNLLARRDLSQLSEAEYVAELVRTQPTAYRYRAKWIGDPRFHSFPAELLRPEYPYSAAAPAGPGPVGVGDTTAFSVSDGKVHVSAIQSNFMGFGSGTTVRGTGINLNNRGSYFSLDPAHHNAVAPRKRSFHTLMAVVVVAPERELLLSTMGGDVQPETNVQVLTRVWDRAQSLQTAIEAPRFAVPSTIYAGSDLFVERGLSLPNARRSDDASLFGHAQGILIGDEVEIGIDPRGDGRLPLPSGWSVSHLLG